MDVAAAIALLGSALGPGLRLATLAGGGLLLAGRCTGPNQNSVFSTLRNLFYSIFLPSLIITHLGASLYLHGPPGQWWLLPLNALISIAVGYALGFSVRALTHPPPHLALLVVTMTAIGDAGGLSIAVVECVCGSAGSNGLFGPDCRQSGFAYVSLTQCVPLLLAYAVIAYGNARQQRPQAQNETEEKEALLSTSSQPGYQSELSAAGVELEIVIEDPVPDSQSRNCTAGYQSTSIFKKIHAGLKELIPTARAIAQPPVLASLATIVIGLVPKLGCVAFGTSAPAEVIAGSLNMFSRAAVPSLMIVVGGILAKAPPRTSRLETRTIIGITMARLLLLPLAGIGVVMLVGKMGLLAHGDNMMRLVLLLQWVAPTTVLFGRGDRSSSEEEEAAAGVLFWQHAGWLISLVLSLLFYYSFLVNATT